MNLKRPCSGILAAPLLMLIGALSVTDGRDAEAARPPRPDVMPEFGISAHFMDRPRYLADLGILIQVWGAPQYDSLAVGTVRADLPPQVAWVSGDTLRHVQISPNTRRPPSDLRWVLTTRPYQTGPCELRFHLHVDLDDEGADETDFVIPIDIRIDSVRVLAPPRPTRFERVRDGQRFRYADGYLVPIERSEALLESEIVTKPRVIGIAARPASRRTDAVPDSESFVAMIDREGRLLAASPIQGPAGERHDPYRLRAARDLLDRWKFAPARTSAGRAVADYVVLRVPLP